MKKLKQLIIPNPNIRCTPGLCLVYVRETFGIGPKYTSATKNWEASPSKHRGQSFPADMWVPVWFSLSDNPDGHVALRQPDGSIWSASDPNSNIPVHHDSLIEIEEYYGGKLTYLGWTDDIEDIPVISRYFESREPRSIRRGKRTTRDRVEDVSQFVASGTLGGMRRGVHARSGLRAMQTDGLSYGSEFVAKRRLSGINNAGQSLDQDTSERIEFI